MYFLVVQPHLADKIAVLSFQLYGSWGVENSKEFELKILIAVVRL